MRDLLIFFPLLADAQDNSKAGTITVRKAGSDSSRPVVKVGLAGCIY